MKEIDGALLDELLEMLHSLLYLLPPLARWRLSAIGNGNECQVVKPRDIPKGGPHDAWFAVSQLFGHLRRLLQIASVVGDDHLEGMDVFNAALFVCRKAGFGQVLDSCQLKLECRKRIWNVAT